MFKQLLFISIIFFNIINFSTEPIYSQEKEGEIIIISERVGEVIDLEERNIYKLWRVIENFQSAVALKLSDGSYVFKIIYLDKTTGEEKVRRVSINELDIKKIGEYIDNFEKTKEEKKKIKLAQASQNDTTNSTWNYLFTPGLCLLPNNAEFIVVGGGFYLRRSHISFRFLYVREFYFRPGLPAPKNLTYIADISIMYNLFKDDKSYFASGSAGIAYLYCRINNDFKTPGIPIEGKFFLKSHSFHNIGFGVVLFANINRKEYYHGALICVQLGKL